MLNDSRNKRLFIAGLPLQIREKIIQNVLSYMLLFFKLQHRSNNSKHMENCLNSVQYVCHLYVCFCHLMVMTGFHVKNN